MQDGAARAKILYDRNTKTPEITFGSTVLLHYDGVKSGKSPKFHKVWRRPCLVTSKSDDGLLYRLRHCSTGKEPKVAVHANPLKLYQDDRDSFFLRHNIPRKDVAQPASPVTQPVTPSPVAAPDTTADDIKAR